MAEAAQQHTYTHTQTDRNCSDMKNIPRSYCKIYRFSVGTIWFLLTDRRAIQTSLVHRSYTYHIYNRALWPLRSLIIHRFCVHAAVGHQSTRLPNTILSEIQATSEEIVLLQKKAEKRFEIMLMQENSCKVCVIPGHDS